MRDELRNFALEAFIGVLFGDYATPKLVEDIKRLISSITSGLFSLPVRFPWPMNKLPVLAFGKSMDARQELQGIICDLLQERRADFAAVEETGKSGKSGGIFDKLVEIQQQRMEPEEMQEGSVSFDDDFIIDNVRGISIWSIRIVCFREADIYFFGPSSCVQRSWGGPDATVCRLLSTPVHAPLLCLAPFVCMRTPSLPCDTPQVILSVFAAIDTTSVTLSRILQLLKTADDGNEIVDKLIQELSNVAKSNDDELDGDTEIDSDGASRTGIFREFPLLDAIVLESVR